MIKNSLFKISLNFRLMMGTKKKKKKKKDGACCFEQILEAVPLKAAVIQPLASRLTNHPNRLMLHSHNHNTHTCDNIVNTIMTNEHTSLEKYTSHTLFEMVAKGLRKGYVWEVGWRLNRDCNILTPCSSVFSSTSFLILLGCSTGGPEGPSRCWVWFSLPRTATNWLQTN